MIDEFASFLRGRHYLIYTDHKCLSWLNKKEQWNNRIFRWALTLQQFDFEVSHVPGKHNSITDAFSRALSNFLPKIY